MKLLLLLVSVLCLSCSHTYYVVRHAEKAAPGPNMTSDVPLSEEGQKRAEQVRNILRKKKIAEVYATNTIRAKATAQPTADLFGKTITIYGPTPDQAFIQQLKGKKENILVVGHSNTVDDIANGLAGKKVIEKDLTDSEYNHLYIIKVRKKKVDFTDLPIYPAN
jgi:phosphohistidine phosphatase SixA